MEPITKSKRLCYLAPRIYEFSFLQKKTTGYENTLAKFMLTKDKNIFGTDFGVLKQKEAAYFYNNMEYIETQCMPILERKKDLQMQYLYQDM